MKKRILTVLLAVCLVFALGTVSALADESDAATEPSYVAKIGNQQYESLKDAVRAVTTTEKTTIKLLSDCSGEGIIVPEGKNIVFDFDGHTYTISGQAVGSLGTESNGFQLLKNSTIVMQNGEIIADHNTVQVVIQNYSNLTLNNMTIDATKGSNNVSYVMSNNCGAVYLTGSTSLTATENGVAFDVCDYNGYTGVTVTVDTTGTIIGEIEVSNPNGDDSNEQLIIKRGNFVGSFDVQDENQPVEVTGGSFKNSDDTANKSVQNYFPDDQALTVDNNGNVVSDTDNSEARIGSTYYDTLAGAIAAAEAGDTVILVDDIEVDLTSLTSTSQGVFDISKNITIDGGNNTIKAISTETEKGQGHVFLIRSDVTIKNLTIDGNRQIARTGIQAYGASANVDIENVYIHDCYAYGVLVNNGATVNAKQLRTSDNGWGGVNADTNGASSKFSMSSGTLNETYSVVVEDDNTTATTDVNLSGGTYNNIQIKTDKTDVNISGGSYTDIVGYSDSKGSYTPNSGDASVTGGTFRNNVNEFATVNYVVSGSRGYTYFNDFDKAMAYAGVGDDIDFIVSSTTRTHRVRFYYENNVYDTYEVVDYDEVELPTGQYDGKKIDGWKRDDGKVFKPGDDVTITRNTDFTVILRNGAYDIVIDDDIKHGDVSTDVSSADKGATVYIYVDPDIGYVLDDLDVYYGYRNQYSVNVKFVRTGVYSFIMPGNNVYITATFRYESLPFTDVNRSQWFYDEVYYVYTNGMMEGDSATTFNPDGRMTRAMFWAVLGRIDGATITGNDWAEEARAWAMREGVSDGTNPNDYVTREQMVTMLWRYAGEKNGSASLIRYTDADKISSYAVEAMRWAIGNGIIEGMTSTTLEPQGTATRAQCAAIFMRFDQM